MTEHPGTERRPSTERPGPPPLRWHRTAVATGPGEGAADAPTFLLVHGVGLSHRSFSRLAAVLAPHGTVLAPDLPGHGRAPGAGRRTTIDEIAASVAAGLAARLLGDGPVVVLGHSLGAEVATALARQRPELVHGLVLVGPVVDPAAPTAVGQGLRLARDMLVEPPLTAVMVGREYVHCGPVTYGAGVRSMLRWSTLDGLGGLEVPLLVVRGARDPIAPTRWAEQLRARVRDGTVLEVPRAVHNLVHSHPEEVGSAVLALAARLRRP